MNDCHHPTMQQGFSLIELIIVMAIIGLLTAFALPVYQHAQTASQRQLAKVALIKSAQWLEQAAITQGSYPTTLADTVWQSPHLQYQLSVKSQGQTYLLSATPTGSQGSDSCGVLTLDQSGLRGSKGDTINCWSK
jgi:type IV pilus assembly protein PilE